MPSGSNTYQAPVNQNDYIKEEFASRCKTTGPEPGLTVYPNVSILKSDSSKGFDRVDPNDRNAKAL